MAIASVQTSIEIGMLVWKVVRLPLRIFLIGLSVILLFAVWGWLGLPSAGSLVAWFAVAPDLKPARLNLSAALAALMVMTSALSVVGLLWWLIDRYFGLVSKGKVAVDLSAMRDLPMGLPDGTIRSVLALFVAVVGLPILIFSNILHLDNAIAGYVNGIIAGVFGFYFGSRTTSAATQAVTQAVAAGRLLDANNAAAVAKIATIESERDAALRDGQKDPVVDTLTRQLEIASVLADPIGPLLPPGLLPANLGDAVAAGQSALVALGSGTPGPETLQRAKDAAAALTAPSALAQLIKTAAPHAGASPATLAALLALGWKLGAPAFQRWDTLLLGAPVTATVIDAGTVTQDEIAAALAAAEAMPAAWTAAMKLPGFTARLPDLVMAADAVDRLWAEFSAPATTDNGAFDNRDQIMAGLESLRRQILAGRFGRDLVADVVKPVLAGLARTADADLQATGVDGDSLLKAALTAGKASAAATGTDSVRAAFDALVTLVAIARSNKVDLPATLSEVKS